MGVKWIRRKEEGNVKGGSEGLGECDGREVKEQRTQGQEW